MIIDEAGTAWVTDGGLNAIVAVDPMSLEVTVYPLPEDRPDANLNTASFDGDGMLWFTGQNGIYGCVDPDTGELIVYDAPEGPGPYGVTTTPDGVVYYASLAGSHIARIESDRTATVIEPPTPEQGARRVWSDSQGADLGQRVERGQSERYTPDTDTWDTWHLPAGPRDVRRLRRRHGHRVGQRFRVESMVRFDPTTVRALHTYVLPHDPGTSAKILGRPGRGVRSPSRPPTT